MTKLALALCSLTTLGALAWGGAGAHAATAAAVPVAAAPAIGASATVDYDGPQSVRYEAAPNATRIYVSPDGSDAAPGTLAQPFRTIARAQAAVRALTAGMSADVVVDLRGGSYRLDSPLSFSAAAGDSGENGQRVIYQAYGYGTPQQEQPVISGGRGVGGWTLVDPGANLWRADLGAFSTRQLYRDGKPLRRGQTAKIPGEVTITKSGYTTTSAAPQGWADPASIELEVSTGTYSAGICGVKAISGDAEGSTITMDQPCFRWYRAVYSYEEEEPEVPQELLPPGPIRNSRSFLSKPQTWAIDETSPEHHYVYYRGQPGEDPNEARFAAPRLQTLLSGSGTPSAPLHDLSFRGLDFTYSSWLRPSGRRGIIGIFGDAYYDGGSPSGSLTEPTTRELSIPAAVEFEDGEDLSFEGDRFERLGGDGLAVLGSRGDVFRGNLFTTAAGAGLRLEGKGELSSANLIEQSWAHRIGLEYRGGPGIFVDAMRDSTIEHNQVDRTPYSGIVVTNVGGGGSGTRILDNRVFDTVNTLPDGGGIYTNGAEGTSFADGARVEGNVVHDVVNPFFQEIDPEGEIGTPNALYTDDGGDFITLRRNVVFHNHQSWGGVLPGRMRFDHNYWDDDQLVFYGPTEGLQIAANTLLPGKEPEAACEAIVACEEILASAGPTAPWRELLGLGGG